MTEDRKNSSRDAQPAVRIRAPFPARLRSALSPRDVLFVLFRHGKAVAAAFLLVAAAASAVALLLPDVYKSEAKMLVRLGRESVSLDPTATIGQSVQPIQTRKSEINSELELLKSRGLAEAVVTRISPQRILNKADAVATAPLARDNEQRRADGAETDTRDTAEFADAVLKVMREVKVEVAPDSNVLYVSYSASDPVRARDIVAAYVSEYLDLRLKVYRNPDSQSFFARQHDRSQEQLDALQQQVRELKDRTGLADIAAQRTNLLARIGALRSAYDDARTTLAASRATADQLRISLATMPDSVVTSRTTNAPNSSVEALRQRLAELRIDEQDISSRYVADSPTVVTIKAKVREATSLLKDAEQRAQETTGPNANREAVALRLQGVLADVAAGEARVTQVEANLANAEAGLTLLNKTQITLDDLTRQAAAAEANVQQYAKVLEVSRVDTALETNKISNISVYEPAKLPLEPEGPKRKLLLAVGLLLAGMAGGGVAFALESLDHTVKRPEDLRLVGARIDHVVSIPRLTSGSALAKRFGDHFDDFADGLRHLFGTAGRSTARRSTSLGGSFARMIVALPGAAVAAVRQAHEDLRAASQLAVAVVRRNHFKPAPLHATLDGGISLIDDERDFGRRPFAGGRIVAEHEALQDLDDDERPRAEPTARPEHRFFHTLRLIAYGVRRDAAARWRRDGRPNLQLADRRHRTAAAEAMWVGARGLFEQVMLDTDPDRTGRMPRTVAVVGCRPDSGATTVAAHLAGVMAERFADDDGTETTGGVLLLVLPDSARHAAADDTADYAARGTPVRHLRRAELATLNTGPIRAALDQALTEYAHVVLDLPPVFNDARGGRFGEVREDAGPRLAGLCDVSVVVIEAETLRREAAGQALQQLERADASPSSIVLNKRTYPIPQWIYKRA